jgi:PST family polysaccharide transporter
VRFAANVIGRFGVTYTVRNLDNLLVGWKLGSTALGFYKKAYDLFVLSANQLLSPISAVVIGALSRSSSDREQFRRFFLGGLSILALVGMGLGADLTLIGMDLIRLLLGPGWESAGRIFTYFGSGIGVMLIYNTQAWIHLSIGRADRGLRWGLLELAITGVLFVLALPFGPEGVAIAWTISYWVLVIPAFWYAGRPIHFGVKSVIEVVWRFLVASIAAGFGTYWVVGKVGYLHTIPGAMGALERIVITSAVMTLFYVVAVAILHRGYGPFRQLARLIPDLLPNRKSGSRELATASVITHD